MSEQENTAGENVPDGTSVVMIESSGTHKQPYRPTELHDSSTDLHHIRSKAPAVPSVAEDFKETADSSESKERKDSEECAMTSENYKPVVVRKLSSNISRRGSSPEKILLAPLEVQTTRETAKPTSQTIPAQISAANAASGLALAQPASEENEEGDSITDEIVELRTPKLSRPVPEWNDKSGESEKNLPEQCNKTSSRKVKGYISKASGTPHKMKKKEVLWNETQYLQHVQEMGDSNRTLPLQQRSSIGPCFQSTSQFGGPSGISINIPNKSQQRIDVISESARSVINISVSKKCLINKSISRVNNHQTAGVDDASSNLQTDDTPSVKFLDGLQRKMSSIGEKIKSVFNL